MKEHCWVRRPSSSARTRRAKAGALESYRRAAEATANLPERNYLLRKMARLRNSLQIVLLLASDSPGRARNAAG